MVGCWSLPACTIMLVHIIPLVQYVAKLHQCDLQPGVTLEGIKLTHDKRVPHVISLHNPNPRPGGYSMAACTDRFIPQNNALEKGIDVFYEITGRP
jgi:hypothetical protein